jgi:hypothetical protein
MSKATRKLPKKARGAGGPPPAPSCQQQCAMCDIGAHHRCRNKTACQCEWGLDAEKKKDPRA